MISNDNQAYHKKEKALIMSAFSFSFLFVRYHLLPFYRCFYTSFVSSESMLLL
nr:MAG TPA: hypothetical protein [Caudoviricetes sp.]